MYGLDLILQAEFAGIERIFLSKRQSLAPCLELEPSAGDSLGTLKPGDSKTAAVFCKEKGERSRDSPLCP